MIWTILGVILAIWLAFTAIGGIFATLKTFLIIGLIAAVVVIVVSFLARRPRRGGRRGGPRRPAVVPGRAGDFGQQAGQPAVKPRHAGHDHRAKDEHGHEEHCARR